MRFSFGLYSTKHERLDSTVSSNETGVSKTESLASQAIPNIAVGGSRLSTQDRSGKESQNVSNVQAISLPIGSKRLEISGLVPGQIIEIRPSRETSTTPPWAPVLSSTISVIVGGCIAAGASWWTSRNQALTALKTIAAQNLREEIKALQDGIAAVESSSIPAQISAPGEFFSLFISKCKAIRPISHLLDGDLEKELLQVEAEVNQLIKDVMSNSGSTKAQKFLLGAQKWENKVNERAKSLSAKVVSIYPRIVSSLTSRKRQAYERLKRIDGS